MMVTKNVQKKDQKFCCKFFLKSPPLAPITHRAAVTKKIKIHKGDLSEIFKKTKMFNMGISVSQPFCPAFSKTFHQQII